jgi:hypothetical protein
MTLDDANKWLVAVANVGVLVGFLLVAYQLSLNTKAIRLQATVGADQQTIAGELAFMGETTHEAFALAVLDPGALTDAQVGQMWAYLNVGFNASLNLWRAYEAGFVSAEELESSMEFSIPNYVGYAFGRIYWDAVKQGFPPEFADRVDAVAAKHPNTLVEQFRAMLEGVRNARSAGTES